jgi:phosphoglycerate dehydrogenase-like enzyme
MSLALKRVVVLDDYEGIARLYADWTALGSRASVEVIEQHIPDEDELAERISGNQIVVAMRERTKFGRSLLEKLPSLELIVTTGPVNSVIDLEAVTERGAKVWATRGFLPPATELTWALILACSKNVCTCDSDMKRGVWQSRVGQDLHGARLGVIGLGYYGSEVARVASAFRMDVVAWSQNLTEERCDAVGAKLVSKDELLTTSDFVTIHLRLSDRTRSLIAASELNRMKRSAYLINTSRGPIVDEDALASALAMGLIAGAGLDVFDVEPLPADHILRKLENVVTTPHIGYITARSYGVFFEDVIDNILCHLDGRPGRPLGPSPRRDGDYLVPG